MSNILEQINEVQSNIREIKSTWGQTIMTLDNIKTTLRADRQKAIDEAYKRGLEDGKARNENGCVGCKYDNERLDHSPCIYCCNAYSNEWMPKEKSDEIKAGDWVFNKHVGATSSAKVTCVDGQKVYMLCDDGSCGFADITDLEKTNVSNPKIKKLLEMLRGEQRNCSTCKHLSVNNIDCIECYFYKGYNRWEPKEGAE